MRHLVGIYSWTNTKTGKIYIGSSVNCARRMTEHRSRLRRGSHVNAKLQAAWNKYGESSFEFRMVFTVLKQSDLEKVEQEFLDEHSAVLKGYNLAPTAGNTFGWVATPETRARMSEAARRRDHSIQIEAMRKATTGKKRPQHVIDAMQAGRKAKGLSDATRKKMSASAVARSRYSADDRRKMAEMHDNGMSYAKIAELVGVDPGSVYRYVTRWRKDHGVKA